MTQPFAKGHAKNQKATEIQQDELLGWYVVQSQYRTGKQIPQSRGYDLFLDQLIVIKCCKETGKLTTIQEGRPL